MRSCTPGNERALSVKTVPRIKKSFTWLYFFLSVLLAVAAAVFGVDVELGSDGAPSCARAYDAAAQATSAAVQSMVIHCGPRMPVLLTSLDGNTSAGGCQARLLLLVFFIVFFVIIIVNEIAIFRGLVDFFFVVIDFGGTFRATDHGSTLRKAV